MLPSRLDKLCNMSDTDCPSHLTVNTPVSMSTETNYHNCRIDVYLLAMIVIVVDVVYMLASSSDVH